MRKAWILVGNHLKTHGKNVFLQVNSFYVRAASLLIARLPLEDQYCLPAITNDVPLEYLIPTTTGAGALTVSLVDYLVLTHNDFIEKCSSKVMDKTQRYESLFTYLN